MQLDQIAGNRRREVEAHTEFTIDNRDRTNAARERDRKLSASEKARLLSVVRNQIRLGEALEVAGLSQRTNDRADVVLRIEQEQVEEVTERELVLSLLTDLEIRRGKLLRRSSARPSSVTPAPPVKIDAPSSWSARRLTSAKRTCSITCRESLAPGTSSMLMMLAFGDVARATSATRSIVCVLETRPDNTSPSALVITVMSSPGNSW
jgi:hypothetical protein